MTGTVVAGPPAAVPVVAATSTTTAAQPLAPAARLVSLDIFRGVTIAGMLLVNNPGSWTHIYGPLRHAEWNGWTPTDLIFPFFVFIVGVAITLSFGQRLESGATKRQLLSKAAQRAAIIFALGLVLHGFPSYDLANLRIPGVLQRIAVCYFAAAAIVLVTGVRGQALAAAALLVVYWLLMKLVPVPGYGAGLLWPESNLAAYLDRLILGTQHLWASSRTWDPEGILSTLPAIGTALIGVLAGHELRASRTPAEKTARLFVAANTLLVLGIVWHQVFPINKNLWTSSYVLFTGGMALHFLAFCYWLADVKGLRRWGQPFVAFGMNSIAAFFLSSLFARVLIMVKVNNPAGGDPLALKTYLYNALYASWLEPLNASLAYAVTYVLLWLGVMAVLYQRKIFLKV